MKTTTMFVSVFCVVALAACGDAAQQQAMDNLIATPTPAPTPSAVKTEEVVQSPVAANKAIEAALRRQSFSVADVAALPVCDEQVEAQVAYATAEQSFFVCQASAWEAIVLPAGQDGKAGEDGRDGRDGSDGVGCVASAAEGGVSISCGGGAPIFVAAATGPQGIQGERGLPGESVVGPQGERGVQGIQGERGLPGESVVGPQGERGVQGIQGERGLPGETVVGPQGERGIQGVAGSNGQNGLSARVTNKETCVGYLGDSTKVSGTAIGGESFWYARVIRYESEYGDQTIAFTLRNTAIGSAVPNTELLRWNATTLASAGPIDASEVFPAGVVSHPTVVADVSVLNVTTWRNLRYPLNAHVPGEIKVWMGSTTPSNGIGGTAFVQYTSPEGTWKFQLTECNGLNY